MQTKVSWNKDTLEPIFKELYAREMAGKKDFIPMMFEVDGSEKDTESYDSVGGEGLMEEWGRSGNAVNYEDVEELWQKRFRHQKFSLGRVIDRDLIDDLKLTQVKDKIRSLADAVYKTRQYQAVEDFNNAFLTSTAVNFRGRTYNAAGPDGVALCSASHPYSPTNSTDVQSNTGTTDLSIDAWDSTAVLMQEWKDDKGNLMAVIPNTIIVAPFNARKAFQIAGMPGKEVAKYEPGSANYNINIYEGDVNVIVNPYLKNRKAWFAIDDARMRNAHKWFDRRKAENGSVTDFDTEVSKFKVVGRWSYGFIDYSWVFGHNPA